VKIILNYREFVLIGNFMFLRIILDHSSKYSLGEIYYVSSNFFSSMKSEKIFSDAALTTTKNSREHQQSFLFRDAPIVQFSQRIITPTHKMLVYIRQKLHRKCEKVLDCVRENASVFTNIVTRIIPRWKYFKKEEYQQEFYHSQKRGKTWFQIM